MKHNLAIRQAVSEIQISFEDLATQLSVSPPLDLKNKIWNAIQKEESTKILEISSKSNDKKIVEKTIRLNLFQRRDRFKSFAVAASISVIIGAGLLVYMFQKQGNLENEIVSLQQINNINTNSFSQLSKKWEISSNPDIKTVVLAGVENHPETKAIVFVNKKTKQTYLSVENLPLPPEGKAFQLWAIVDGKPVDAGLCELSKDSVQKMLVIDNAKAFAITLEKSGGSKSPTMEQMYVIGEI